MLCEPTPLKLTGTFIISPLVPSTEPTIILTEPLLAEYALVKKQQKTYSVVNISANILFLVIR